MSSKNKNMTALEALELIFDHDSEIEEDVSEAGNSIEVNSESEDSDCEPKDGNASHISPSKTFTSKYCEIQLSSSPSKHQGKLCAENVK